MKSYRITAPSGTFTGEVAGVAFARGVATATDADRRALAYFRRRGYIVEEQGGEDVGMVNPDRVEVIGGDTDAPPQPAKNASTDEWRAYAKAMQMPAEQADAMSRDDLVAHYVKEAGQ